MRIIGDGGHGKVVRAIISGTEIFYGEDACFIAVGDNKDRKREAEKCRHMRFPVLRQSSAVVYSNAVIGEGTVIMAGAVVQPGAIIGRFCIINTGATVDHDCIVGDYAHIAPGAHLCGHVEIGEGTLVGVGVGIAPMCKVPAWSIVKARRLEICPMT